MLVRYDCGQDEEHPADVQNGVCTADCHFVSLTCNSDRSDEFPSNCAVHIFGAKLWNAKTVEDEELQKLHRLFFILENGE